MHRRVLDQRIGAVAEVVLPGAVDASRTTTGAVLPQLLTAAAGSHARAWLVLVAVHGDWPREVDVEQLVRRLELDPVEQVADALLADIPDEVDVELVVTRGAVLVDPELSPSSTVRVPWESTVVLTAAPEASLLRQTLCLARYSGNEVVAVAPSMVPVIFGNRVPQAASRAFADYLGVLKYCRRLACPDETIRAEYEGFVAMLPAQGLAGPALELTPTEAEQWAFLAPGSGLHA